MKPDGQDKSASTINLLYRTLEDARLWEPALTSLADTLGADHVLLDLRSVFTAIPDEVMAARVAPSHLAQFSAHPEYPMLRALVSHAPTSAVIPGEALIDHRMQAKSEFYADVIRPMGGYHSLFAIGEHNGPGHPPLLAACRNARRQPFAPRQRQQLAAFLPHLETVIRLKRRLSALATEGWWYEKVLSALPIGVILLDETGRPCYSNPMAESLLEQSGALSLTRQHGLTASSTEINRQLRLGIQAALGHPEAGADLPLRLHCRHEQGDLWLRISPLVDGGVAAETWAPARVAIFCEGPDNRPLDPAQLHQAFGFTPREAALAQALLNGQELASAARTLGVGRETVRSQLKSMFVKTETNRQADLTRTLGMLQRWTKP